MLIRPIASSRMRIFVTALCNEIISQAGHLLHPTTYHQPLEISMKKRRDMSTKIYGLTLL